MSGRSVRFLSLVAVVAAAVGVFPLPATDIAHAKDGAEKGERLSANKYYKFKPFTLPVLYKGQIEEHFTLVIAFELVDEPARLKVHQRLPRIRDEIYKELLKIVTFRRRGSPMPDIEIFKIRLLDVAFRTVGKEYVKNLLIQQAFKRSLR